MTKLTGPPSDLGPTGKALWRRLTDDFAISDSCGLTLLGEACRCFDRIDQARKIVAEEGMIVRNRNGDAVPHPALQVERAARSSMIQALRSLKLAPEELL